MNLPLRVLFVEDSDNDVRVFIRQLKEAGFASRHRRVATATGMRKALKENVWDLIICDFRMRRFTAARALTLFQKAKLDIPFIVVTGLVGEDVAVQMMKSGAHDILLKDNLARFVPVVRRELSEAEKRREQKGAEKALRESEEKFRAVAEMANFGIFIFRGDRFIYVNPTAAAISGYPEEEMLAKMKFWDIAHPDFKRMIKTRGLARQQGKTQPIRYEFKIATKNGEEKWVDFSAGMIDFEGKPAVLGTALDITERKKTEEELQFRNVLLSTQLEASIAGTLVVDKDGKILFFNRRFQTMWDIPQAMMESGIDEAVLEHAVQQVVTPDRFRKKVQHLYRHRRETSHDEVFLTDGRTFDRYTSPLLGPDGKYHGRIWYFRDISEQKGVEAALHREKKLSDAMIDHMPGIFTLSRLDGRILRWNKNTEKKTGYSSMEIPCMHPLDLIVREDRKKIIDRFGEEIVSGTTSEEADLQTKTGSRIPHLITVSRVSIGDQTYLLGMGVDISERRKAEDALRTSEGRFRTLFEDSRDAVVSVSGRGEWLDLNPAGLELFGISSKEKILKKRIDKIFRDPADLKKLKKTIIRDRFVKNFELSLRCPGGKELEVLVTATTELDHSGKVKGYNGIIHDVTEQKRLMQQFLQAQKMEALGRLAGGIAHDFNNLLTAILGNAEIGLADAAGNDPLKEKLTVIKETAERAARLTRQLLSFSRKEIAKPKRINLNDSLSGLKNMFARLLGEDIDCRYVLSPELDPIVADPQQMEQVIINLVVNAREAMPKGGKLLVATENVYLNEEHGILNPGVSPGAYCKLSVSDTGEGMTPEQMSNIFEPFYTTKPHGTGLGLATVFEIVKRAGGHLSVLSTKDEGSAFEVFIPSAEPQDEAAGELKKIDSQGSPRGQETILVVEDEPFIRELICSALNPLGYRLIVAGDADEAARKVLANREMFDLMITDVILPGENGTALARKLATLSPKTKVLFMSGYAGDQIADGNVLPENAHFLPKPFSLDILARKVRQVLDG